MSKWLILVSVMMFTTGVYIILSKPQLLLILLGAELLMHAAALNFLSLRGPTAEAQLIVMCILVVAVAEATLVLALAFVQYQQTGSMRIDIFEQEPDA